MMYIVTQIAISGGEWRVYEHREWVIWLEVVVSGMIVGGNIYFILREVRQLATVGYNLKKERREQSE